MSPKTLKFLLGLIEGDGSIQVNHWKKKYVQYRIIVKLNNNLGNWHMLTILRDSLLNVGIQHFRISEDKKNIKLVCDHKEGCRQFVGWMNKNGNFYLTKVRKRYHFFKYCLDRDISYAEYSFIKQMGEEWHEYKNIIPFTKEELLNNADFDDWLGGFFEAESCFSNRISGKHSVSVSQKNEKEIIDAVKTRFALPNKVIEKRCGTYIIETYNRKSIDRLLEFCQNRLVGHKLNQCNIFKNLYKATSLTLRD